jgi:hypothetical protein
MDYRRADVAVTESATYSPQEGTAGFQGNRGFCIVVNVATGATHATVGAWGGGNGFGANAVDNDRSDYAIPPNCAVITGESGGRGSFARIKVAPGMLVGILPAATSVELPESSALALCVIAGIKGGHRAEYFSRAKLGAYGPENPAVVDLAARKLVSVNRGGAIMLTTDGRNARATIGYEIRNRAGV